MARSVNEFRREGELTAAEMEESEAAGRRGGDAKAGVGRELDGGGGGRGETEGGELEGGGGGHREDPQHRPGGRLFGCDWVALRVSSWCSNPLPSLSELPGASHVSSTAMTDERTHGLGTHFWEDNGSPSMTSISSPICRYVIKSKHHLMATFGF